MSTTIERYVIRHISGTKANQVEEFDFSKNELSIGRTAGSDIQFDPEQEVIVSREHGKIVKVSSEPPQFSINDNNSRNGIFVNKMRVKGSAPLKPGDEVQLGSNGPVFSFDIHPRPQNMMMETKVMDIPNPSRLRRFRKWRPRPPNRRKRGWVNKPWKGCWWPNARNHSAAWPISSVPSSSYWAPWVIFSAIRFLERTRPPL